MRILVTIGHPAHVHFFKHFVWSMQEKGYELLICATDKDVALRLLDAYGFKYVCIGKSRKNPIAKIADLVKADYRLWQIAQKFGPDILVGLGSISAAHVSALLRKPCIIFDDTEHSSEQYYLYAPFANVICTPSCFKKELGKKQIRYNGYHELAYLHPNRFKPNPSVLSELGLAESDTFIIVRFVAWQAVHDIGHHGFHLQAKRRLVEELEKHGRVLITAENPLQEEFEKYRITTSPEKMHDLLYYATMYIGEGGTMASEAAVLGTPAIHISTGTAGYLEEEEDKYELVYHFSPRDGGDIESIEKALLLLQNRNLKTEWQRKRQRLLNEKIDVTQFMVEFVESYQRKHISL